MARFVHFGKEQIEFHCATREVFNLGLKTDMSSLERTDFRALHGNSRNNRQELSNCQKLSKDSNILQICKRKVLHVQYEHQMKVIMLNN